MRKKIAVVDNQNTCFVYDIATKELLYQEPEASSVAWNSEFEDILCYSGNGMINVKSGNFIAYQDKVAGYLVGFKGSRVFLQTKDGLKTNGTLSYNINLADIPYTLTLDRLIKNGSFSEAYKLSCMGAPESDWRRLAMDAMINGHYEVSIKSFVRLRDLKFINLIQHYQSLQKEGYENSNVFIGEIFAALGKYTEASPFNLIQVMITGCKIL